MRSFGLGLILLVGSTAAAQPRPKRSPPVFGQTTEFRECVKMTMFACGMQDASGMRYGTAHERTECRTTSFRTDGTYVSEGLMDAEHGTYRIRGARVTLTPHSDGADAKPQDLMLSADGEKLGTMTRQSR
jgi:hypothetical protein